MLVMDMTEKDYEWNEVGEKAGELVEELVREGFSGQDIAVIGTILNMRGTYIWMREGFDYIVGKEQVCGDHD